MSRCDLEREGDKEIGLSGWMHRARTASSRFSHRLDPGLGLCRMGHERTEWAAMWIQKEDES
jgi:hypothetical protein